MRCRRLAVRIYRIRRLAGLRDEAAAAAAVWCGCLSVDGTRRVVDCTAPIVVVVVALIDGQPTPDARRRRRVLGLDVTVHRPLTTSIRGSTAAVCSVTTECY